MFSFTNLPNTRPKFLVVLSECFDNYHLPEVTVLSLGYNNHMCDLIVMMSPIMVLFLSSWEIQFGIKSLTGSPLKQQFIGVHKVYHGCSCCW